MPLSESDIQPQLDRRRPGQSTLSTSRKEADRVTILSGVEKGQTLGTPIALLVPNKDQRPGDYKEIADIPRPSHADFTYQMKYKTRSTSGGGRASARETIARVAAGVVAEILLKQVCGAEIVAWVSQISDIPAPDMNIDLISRKQVDQTPVRCPDTAVAQAMIQRSGEVKKAQDSLGGMITCVCRNVPAGLGEPVFDKLEALLAQAMLSLPASKGFEIGSGFAGSCMTGATHNDPYIQKKGRLGTSTNFSGGIQGGISNGEPIYFRVAFKPTATIGKKQITADFNGQMRELEAKGRHDPCVVPRAVPIVEAMAALVLADCILEQSSRCHGGQLL
jgi:chorismate synthase